MTSTDLICFSHLGWDAVPARTQQQLAQAACDRRVFFIEEAVREDGPPGLSTHLDASGVMIVRPVVPALDALDEAAVIRGLIDDLIAHNQVEDYVLWFYTARALPLAHHLVPSGVLYECSSDMIEAAPAQLALEAHLMEAADVTLTGAAERPWSEIERLIGKAMAGRPPVVRTDDGYRALAVSAA